MPLTLTPARSTTRRPSSSVTVPRVTWEQANAEVRANSLLRVKVKITVKNAICESVRQWQTAFLTLNLALTLKSGAALSMFCARDHATLWSSQLVQMISLLGRNTVVRVAQWKLYPNSLWVVVLRANPLLRVKVKFTVKTPYATIWGIRRQRFRLRF